MMPVHRLVALGCVSVLVTIASTSSGRAQVQVQVQAQAQAQAQGPAKAKAKELEWLPFETIDQSALPIVRAKLNGYGSHRLVLDAGFTEFILDLTIVEGSGMKLVKQGEFAEIDYYGRKEKVEVGYLQSLELGEAQFLTVRTLLVEGEDGTGIGGIRSYGRIGRDLLEPVRLTIHYPRRLYCIEASPKDEVPPGGVTYSSAGRFLLVPVELTDGAGVSHDVEFVMDAGTSNSVIDRDFAQKLGLVAKGERVAKFAELQIGGFVSKDVSALVGVMKELPYESRAVGVIGADLLLGTSVTYDFARDQIWLVKVEDGGTASP